VTIPNYWIYDPNADFEILLDYDNNIIEENEKNNHSSFHEWG
jgi:Uma2 family endonuclease